MIRIGLLGCGRIGQVHARSIARLPDKATLVAVADPFVQSAEKLAKACGASIRDAETILASDDIDAVIIGTPTSTHAELIGGAAAAGKAIFCEKPIEMTSERVRACNKIVADAGVPFLTAFQRRFDPTFRALHARIQAGHIGKVEQVILISRDPGPPPIEYIKTSGGLFADMMIHDLDMARFLLEEEPVEVFATGANLVDPAIGAAGDIDTASVLLKTASGSVCQIANSRRATYGYDQRIEVHGSLGMLSAKNMLENQLEFANGNGFQAAPTQPFFLERYSEAYFHELQYFVDAITNGTSPNPGPEDGLRSLLLAEAAAKSLHANSPVAVDLS